jgi:hypothetical protein
VADCLSRCVQVLPPPVVPPKAPLVGIEPNPSPKSVTVISSGTSGSSLDFRSQRSDDEDPIVAPIDSLSDTPPAATPAVPPVIKRRTKNAKPAASPNTLSGGAARGRQG